MVVQAGKFFPSLWTCGRPGCELCGAALKAEFNLDATQPHAPTKLVVVENNESTHNVIVCTLCSCYPTGLLGPSPGWYKSKEYRARVVREPCQVLRERFGTVIGDDVAIRVHDSSADCRYVSCVSLVSRDLTTDSCLPRSAVRAALPAHRRGPAQRRGACAAGHARPPDRREALGVVVKAPAVRRAPWWAVREQQADTATVLLEPLTSPQSACA